MADQLHHRGPDDGGVWADSDAGIALGHRRLAIIDRSTAGRQPMTSADGRFVTVFNGEIYNFLDLRSELERIGHVFHSHSDTEVLVQSCSEWGVPQAIARFNGMFAIAIWDRAQRLLHLARDRTGEKPLYWGRFGRTCLFGSELKSLRACPGWQPELNRDALSAFLRHNYIPSPLSIYRGVWKLPPASILTLSAAGEPVRETYWDARVVARAGLIAARNDHRTDMEAVGQLDALLRDAVRRRMVADVPLGAFLSGGIDSSVVVAMMQAEGSGSVKTFTIGFGETDFNEAEHAKRVAAHLGTDHTELYVGADAALAVVPRLPDLYDEPFADSSQIPTFLVSEMTRRHVTVALSGDGGDEVFAGYPRYFAATSIYPVLERLPMPLRRALASLLRAIPERPLAWAAKLMPRAWRPVRPAEAAGKLAAILTEPGIDALYRQIVSQWDEPDSLVGGGREPRGILWDPGVRADLPLTLARLQFFDLVTYLPDDILTKVDRASMAVSLEARVPLLDHRVIEFGWGLPERLRVRDGTGKWLLRQVLMRHVPRALIDRPKMGFGVPIAAWLRGPLRDWAEELLRPERLCAGDVLNPEPVRRLWQEHQEGTRDEPYRLWTVLMFQAWRQRWQL